MKKIFLLFFLTPLFVLAQQPAQPHAAKIKLKLKKLNFLGSMLYVAAHPDDENTRIITYMANDQLAEAAYLSMTRGDGGQNLIGPEMGELLGLIRTQELLAARRIDGGQQFFTRANDFGFSKSADETLSIWGKEEILHDVVKVYREYQPDVIITRFPADERAGHGHHTSSAILAEDAFELAAKRDVFPEQVKQIGTWKAQRLYTNTGRWWNTSINENTPGIITLNVGGYSSLLGESFTEVAASSRSQHKSQGFGAERVRGDQLEFLEYIKGQRAEKDIFEGVNTMWTRLKGGEKIQPLVLKVIREFNEDNPAASIPALLTIRKEILKLDESVWKKRKLRETEQLIQDCLGLYVGVTADQYWVAPGENVKLTFELVNRSDVQVAVNRIRSAELGMDTTVSLSLKNNKTNIIKTTKEIQRHVSYSDPYWLREQHGIGLFTVNDKKLIGKPENAPAITVSFSVSIQGETFQIESPLFFKWTDPVKGELTRPFEVVPDVSVNLSDEVMVFKDDKPKGVRVVIKSNRATPLNGTIRLQLPEGWQAEPANISFSLSKHGEEQLKYFQVFPSASETTGVLKAVAEADGKLFDHALRVIEYEHIPTQTLLPRAEAKVVRLNLKNGSGLIGYIKGAGDDVPTALRNIGYEVWELKNEEVTSENLKRMDAVVLGIRAFNTNTRIAFMMDVLLDYVKNGGTMIVQYNTNFDTKTNRISPYPLTISRERVAEEDADVRIVKPDHRAMRYPNKITRDDFTGWVQERGLYFPDTWDSNFEALLSMNDKGENAKDGSLLVATYGNGYYVYTGLSFFRQLPVGIAGAYKLFSNLVSLSKSESPPVAEPQTSKPKNKKQK